MSLHYVMLTVTTMNSLKFNMKDMSLASIILGIKIPRTAEGYILNLSHYADKSFQKLNNNDYGLVRTPLGVNIHMLNNKGERVFKYNMLE